MENYYMKQIKGSITAKFGDGKYISLNAESAAAIIEYMKTFLEPEPRNLVFTRVNSDSNGNPRYVVHFTQLGDDYQSVIKKCNGIGGRKFHNKQYGGGIVFQSYSLPALVKDINKYIMDGEIFAGYVMD